MKKSNPILNVLTIFLASIGGCAAVLSGFIIFHSVFVGGFGSPDGKSVSQKAVALQSIDQLEDSFTQALQQEEPHISELSTSFDTTATADTNEPEPQPSEEPESETADNSIPLEYYLALNRANTYSGTMHMLKEDIYDQLVSEHGGNFSADAAQFAVDHITNEWDSNSPESVQTDLNDMEMASDDTPVPTVPEYDETATQAEAVPASASIETVNTFQPEDSVTAETSSAPQTDVSLPVETLVWLSETGEKYHRINNCGRMNPSKARQVTLEEAVRGGYGQCKNCY